MHQYSSRNILPSLCLVFTLFTTAYGGEFQIVPPSISITKSFEPIQFLVFAAESPEAITPRTEDLTTKATFASSNPQVAQVTDTGVVLGVANGDTTVLVTVDGVVKQIPVHVEGIGRLPVVEFTESVLPILFKHGCNSGSCHASQYGKGGLTLSVMGFDPQADFSALTRSSRGRRVAPTKPDESLILRKPTMAMPHGGGKRFDKDSNDYQILSAWISQGAAPPSATQRKVSELIVTPSTRIGASGFRQQIQVTAKYTDGSSRDVTSWARFDSMDESVVTVTSSGVATSKGPGQASVMVRFAGEASLCNVIVPFADSVPSSSSSVAASTPNGDWIVQNIVDEKAAEKFRELGIAPSGLCDDATFLRRAYLDAIGSLPTVDESRAFLDSSEPDKRTKLVNRLLGLTGDPALDIYNDRYAALWSLKWADLIRNNSTVLGESGMWALHNWLKESFRTNKPFDQFVQELITAKGSIFSNGPANYFRIANNPPDLAESTAQLFLGTRLQCAKCHHHPYERYSQADYYGFAAFFARVGTKGSAEFGNFGGEMIVMVNSGGEVAHPKTGAVMKPTPIHGEPIDDPLDRRVPLAKWLTTKDNDYFARNVVNRYVGYLLGRGLVEPIDDMRSTNPPSNIALMDALVKDFRESQFNIKHLMRTIMTSRLYQLESQPNDRNAGDSRFYSHFKVKRISAEPLLDCIDFATGSLTKHPSLPLGTRATELPDAATTNPFLMTFGKPKRASVCECERTPDENLTQALHMLNGDVLATKIADAKGRVATLIAAKKPIQEVVEDLYLATLCRRPSSQELEVAQQMVAASPTPDEAYQDLLWALINSKHFLFIR
jgi:hypothetical protein